MSGYVALTVGEPWPYPAPSGMHVMLGAGAEGLNLMLAVGCDKPRPGELKALRAGAIKLAIWSAPPLTWIMLDAGAISCDAPYARGITRPEHSAEIEAAAALTAALPEATRGLVTIAVVDRGRVAALRVISMSRAWWRTLATSVSAGAATLDRRIYDAAVDRTIATLTTAQMISRSAIVEIAGRV